MNTKFALVLALSTIGGTALAQQVAPPPASPPVTAPRAAPEATPDIPRTSGQAPRSSPQNEQTTGGGGFTNSERSETVGPRSTNPDRNTEEAPSRIPQRQNSR
jgi:hypothetical protein